MLRPPTTEKHPVTDEYHGVKVVDDYRWLEDASDAKVKKWTEDEAQYSRSWLNRLPSRPKIRKQLEEWALFKSPVYFSLGFRNGIVFAMKHQPPESQNLLVRLPPDGNPKQEHVILDPSLMDSSGLTTIDFYSPSRDGSHVAISLSQAGTEAGTVHFYETATGKEVAEPLPRVKFPTAGGSVAWNPEGTGVYYTRYPAPGERADADLRFYQQVYFHKFGTPVTQDTYELGKDFPRISETALFTPRQGDYVVAEVKNGDGGEFAYYLRNKKGDWTQVAKFTDNVVDAVFGRHNDLYLLSRDGAPHKKILVLDLEKPELAKAKEVVPASDVVIQQLVATDHYLYSIDLVGGPHQLRQFELATGKSKIIPLPPVSVIHGFTTTTGDDFLLENESYVMPATWYQVQASKGFSLEKIGLSSQSPVDFSDIVVKREFATSKDGTKVPVNILMSKKSKQDGARPTILRGYGTYGVSLSPYFSPEVHLWLKKGGVIAIANLRGGGEFGEEWHEQGKLTKKQNVFDDFIAVAEYLIHAKYTRRDKLAIEGGSAGGLLMGAALTQRPELFQTVVAHVGIYDMLRVELDPNGSFNVTEFGTVKDPEQFKALYAYSPYHHVVKKGDYPSILLLTGANDGRVNPYQSKKMAARLQALGGKKPVLLRVDFAAGHGSGMPLKAQIDQQADVLAFLFEEMQLRY